MPGLILLLLLAPGSVDGGQPEIQETALQVAQALVASDVDKLVALTPAGFAFAGRQAWNQADIRAEWTHALERRPLKGTQASVREMLSYDEMVHRYGSPPERWSTFNLSGSRIVVVELGQRPMLVIFRKKGDGWVLLGVGD